MHRYQTLLQPALRTVTRVQKVDVSTLANRRNRSFYLFEGLGINSLYELYAALVTAALFASTMTDGLVAVAETRARQYSVHPVTIHSILAGWTERHVQAAE